MSEGMKGYLEGVVEAALPNLLSTNSTVGLLLGRVSAAVWHETFWLPPGVTWDDLKDTDDLHFPQFHDVWMYPLAVSLVFLALQHLLVEPYLLAPLARAAGIPHQKPPPPKPSPPLEFLYNQHKLKPPQQALEKAAKSASMEIREAERWLRARNRSVALTQYDYFITAGSIVMYHISFCITGWILMFNRPWVFDTSLYWKDYPYHPLDASIWWYYILELAFYYSMLISEMVSPRRGNDGRLKIFLHHLTTVALMTFSWVCNFLRFGLIVLLVHECADVPLLIAKMCIYAKRKTIANVIFAVFLVLWLLTRCILYPFWVMHSMFFEATTYMFMPSAYIFMSLMTALLVLNLIWTFLIFRVFVRTIIWRSELKELHTDDSDASDAEQSKKKD